MTEPAALAALIGDPAFLAEATPERLHAVLRGVAEPGPPVLRAYRRALPRLTKAPAHERFDILRAMAATEEPDAVAALDALGWTVRWSLEPSSAFHLRLAAHEGMVYSVAFGEVDGHPVVASGGGDRKVRLWDPRDQSMLRELDSSGDPLAVLAFGTVGGRVLLAGGDFGGRVRLWAPADGTPVLDLDAGGQVVALVFTGAVDGRELLAIATTENYDGRADLWDAATGEHVRRLSPDYEHDLGLAITRIGGRPTLVTGDLEAVRLLDLATDEEVKSWDCADIWADDHFDYPIGFTAPVLTGEIDGRPVLGAVGMAECGGADPREEDRAMVFWDAETLVEVSRRDLVCDEVPLAAGPTLLATAAGSVVRVGSLAGEPVADLIAQTAGTRAAAFGTMGGRTWLATAGMDGDVLIWDTTTPHRHRTGEGSHRQSRKGQAVSGLGLVGDQLVVGDKSHHLSVWKASTGGRIGTIDGSIDYDDLCQSSVAAGMVAGKPHALSSGTAPGTVLWNLNTRKAVHRLGRRAGPVGLAFGKAAGRWLVAVDGDVWDAVTGELVAQLYDVPEEARTHLSGNTSAVALGTAASRPVAATMNWNGLHLWDPLTGGHVRAFPHRGWGAGLAVARSVLAAGEHKHVSLWRATTGESLGSLPHAAPVTCLAVADQLMVTGTKDGTVALWDVATQRRLTTLATFAHQVRAVAVAPPHVFAQAADGRVMAWRVDLPGGQP